MDTEDDIRNGHPRAPYASWRVRPRRVGARDSDVVYQAVAWHCAQCAGRSEPLFVCAHPHPDRDAALVCARSYVEASR